MTYIESTTKNNSERQPDFDESQKLSEQPIPVISRLHSKINKVGARRVCLQSISPRFDITERRSFLFISIKNRQFTKNYVNWFAEMSHEIGNEGIICPVDEPYYYNRMAELRTSHLPDSEFERIHKLAADVSRMAQKAINRSGNNRLRLTSWSEFSDQTPQKFKQEVQTAFDCNGPFQRAIIEHVASVKGDLDITALRSYAKFFLCEIPVLAAALYGSQPSLDVYPGDQADLFWQIELGDFEEELPELTTYIRSGEPLLYMNTID